MAASDIMRFTAKLAVAAIFFLLAVSSSFLDDLSYDEILELGKSCYPKDSCNHSRGVSRRLESLRERNCGCDDLCARYGDCCIDASQRPFTTADSRDWTCKALPLYGDLWLRHTCAATWEGPELVRAMCETDADNTDLDPVSAMPATNPASGVTYRNYYCAICNSDSANVVLWTPRLECTDLRKYNATFKNLTADYVKRNLAFDDASSQWGVYLYRDGERFFYGCYIDPFLPSTFESAIRSCSERMISACPPGWRDPEVSEKCGAYTGMIYEQDDVYKNVHCALCNGVNITQLSCNAVTPRNIIPRFFQDHSFALLLDIKDTADDHGEVGLVDACQNGEMFDPFFKVCRNVICGFVGYTFDNGRCTPAAQKTTSTPATSTSWTFTDDVSHDVWDSANSTEISSSGEVPDVVYEEKNSTEMSGEIPVAMETTEGTTTRMHPEKTAITAETIPTEIGVVNASFPQDDVFGFYEQHFLECPKAIIGREDYVIYDNGTIYIPNYKSWYNPTAYYLNGTEVLVCFNYTSSRSKFSHHMGYVTLVGLGISMVCLLLHFITFLIIPDLQNLSGKNLVSLTVSLFAAYTFFIVGRLDILGSALCTADAILTYYFFQVSFFWMNTMAFDVWRTLKMATTELRVSSGRQWKRFLAYSSYSWLSPLLIVGASVIVENIDSVPEEFHPGFGETSCWFKHRRALLVFFAAPLVVIMTANLCFFVFSARMIIITTKTSMKHQSTAPRRNFKLYLRLALIMGLTWAVGLVAGYVDLETLWYVFIVLNTLQGLFIFVAFSCTRKVAAHLRDRFKGSHQPSTYRSSSLNSGFNSNSTVHTHLGRKISQRESLDMGRSSFSDKSTKHAQ